MIYLHNTLGLQWCYIPQGLDAPQDEMSLVLHGNVTEKDTTAQVLYTRRSREYVRVTFRFQEKLDKGEYRYELRSGDVVVSEGLAQIGEYEAQRRQYNKTIEYKQYGAKH